MKLRSKKVLIFDIDGTLVNSGIDWERIRKLFRASVSIDIDGKPLAEVISSLPEKVRVLLEEAIAEAETSSLKYVKADEELRNLFMKAKRLGYVIVVISLRTRSTATEVLRRLGVMEFVDILVTRDDTPRRDEQLAEVLNVLKAESKHVVFFGDTPWDAEAARSLSIRFIRIVGDGRVGSPPENLLRTLREVLGACQ